MHLQSPNVAEEQEKEVHGDTLQKNTNPTTMKCKKKLLNQMYRFVMAESPPEIISPPFLQEKTDLIMRLLSCTVANADLQNSFHLSLKRKENKQRCTEKGLTEKRPNVLI